jgi:hypothetical protein
VIGNNVTAGPLQHRCWRGCLTGTALDKFNKFTQAIGNKTAANSVQVKRQLVTFFAPREVLCQWTRCIKFHITAGAGNDRTEPLHLPEIHCTNGHWCRCRLCGPLALSSADHCAASSETKLHLHSVVVTHCTHALTVPPCCHCTLLLSLKAQSHVSSLLVGHSP